MKKKIFETIEQLVSERRGYKYLKKNFTSPYQGYIYDLKSKKIITCPVLNEDVDDTCGEGWSLATLDWILRDCNILNHVIVEFTIPKNAKIIVPLQSDGKFRTDKIKYKKTHTIKELFPELYKLQERLKTYQPVNPITAIVMPDKFEIKKIMASVWASVRDSVGDSVWASVGDSVWASVRASVWASVGDSSYICGYYEIVKFLDLDYRHPVFDLIDMGIIVIDRPNNYMVFGKDGKHLGDIDK